MVGRPVPIDLDSWLPTAPSAKIKPAISSRDAGENKFWNDTLLPAASKFVPQNLQILFWLPSLAFLPRLQIFVGFADITFISGF